jgi:molecular chaperone GrpE
MSDKNNTHDHPNDTITPLHGEKNTQTSEHHHTEESVPTKLEPNKVEMLEEELTKAKDQWLRTAAELDNVRRRAQKEREDALKFGASKFAKDMLSVLDNIQRAQSMLPVDIPENLHGIAEGMSMVEKEILNIFQRQGISQIDASEGTKFDPNMHQAMFEAPHDTIEANHIIQVVQEGYMLHDRLLRPAMVGVSKGKA